MQRVFGYADEYDRCLYGFSFLASIGAGAVLPLMTLVFGEFVAKFNAFQAGEVSPDVFRSDVASFV